MTDADAKTIIEVVCAYVILATPILVVLERIKIGKSYSARSVQFVAVATLVPAIVILASRGVLNAESTGTILGALTGYLLSRVGEYQGRESGSKSRAENSGRATTP